MAWGYQQFGVSSTATAGDPTLGRLVHLSVFASGKGGCYFLPIRANGRNKWRKMHIKYLACNKGLLDGLEKTPDSPLD